MPNPSMSLMQLRERVSEQVGDKVGDRALADFVAESVPRLVRHFVGSSNSRVAGIDIVESNPHCRSRVADPPSHVTRSRLRRYRGARSV